MEKLNRFLDSSQRIHTWPSKYTTRQEIAKYLVSHFSEEKIYTEQEVNSLIDQWHTFGDNQLLRRWLVEEGFLLRTDDGSNYWKSK